MRLWINSWTTNTAGINRIYGYNPSENILKNFNNSQVKKSSEYLKILDKILANGENIRVPNTGDGSLTLDYAYLSRFGDVEYSSYDNDLRVLIDKMNEYKNNTTEDCIGKDLLNNASIWSRDAADIYYSSRSQFIKCIFETCVKNKTYIYWFSGTMLSNLIEFYSVLFGCTVEVLQDNVYFFNCERLNSRLLLINNPVIQPSECVVDKDNLDKYIYKTLFNTLDNYTPIGFDNTTVNYTETEKIIDEIITSVGTNRVVEDVLHMIHRKNQYLKDYYKVLNTLDELFSNLEVKRKMISNSSEFIKTLNKLEDSFQITTVNSLRGIIITVSTNIFNYDERVIRKMYESGSIESFCCKDDFVYKLLQDVFIENKLDLLTQTRIVMSMSETRVTRDYNVYEYLERFLPDEQIEKLIAKTKTTYLPNPHIARYDCWGQNAPVIRDLFKACKWEELLYCIKASLGNINFNDSTVVRLLTCWLDTCPEDIILVKDCQTGELLTKKQLEERYGN